MNPLKLTESEMLDLWRESTLYDDNDNKVMLEVIEEGEWIGDGKYQDKQMIFANAKTGKHYSYYISRSGSYFTDYEYMATDSPVEVEKVTETITVEKWVLV